MSKIEKLPPELQAKVDKTRADAHREAVAAGKIQFRLDPETMELLLRYADDHFIGAGVLARMWVKERLAQELSGTVDSPVSADEMKKMIRQEVREAMRQYDPKGKKSK